MNVEISDTSLRMSGKVWQIRAFLKAWSKRPITLQQFIYLQKWKRQRKN
ncbi:Z-ring formation inhibitor MciZ [Lihuaxuella thermophila]|uniref:Z-ring formation inhibitor MciZ n=1 Tax=Lihuaxuella thermophila TaxID=1173111 RepID=A0A1H8ER38_9BACL|nr:Z-ring formation inhibitor MciZ [Lihuaxuella thermophila]SEN21238.1 Protein of unknown function [Lihuaxuella thermophila]